MITSISLDHVDILGNTVYDIAKNKAGIIKEGANVVSYPVQEAEAMAALFEETAKKRVKLILPNRNAVQVISLNENGAEFLYDGEAYKLSLVGEHQILNGITAIEAIKNLHEKGFAAPSEDIKKAFSTASIPARFEVLCKKPYIVFDGCHNEQGIKAYLKSAKKTGKRPVVAVIGMLSTKDYESAVNEVSAFSDFVLSVPVPYPTTVKPEKIAELARKNAESEAFSSCGEALKKAAELAGEKGIIIACGSFYLANEIKNAVKNYIATT